VFVVRLEGEYLIYLTAQLTEFNFALLNGIIVTNYFDLTRKIN